MLRSTTITTTALSFAADSRETEEPSRLTDLPNDILVGELLPRLDAKSLAAVASTGRRLRNLVDETIEGCRRREGGTAVDDVTMRGKGCRDLWLRRELVAGRAATHILPSWRSTRAATWGTAVAFFEAGRGVRVATADGTISPPMGPATDAGGLVWSHDGRGLWVTAGEDLLLLDRETGAVRTSRHVPERRNAPTGLHAKISPAGTHLASVGGDGRLSVEDLRGSGAEVNILSPVEPDERVELLWSPRGRFLVVERQGPYRGKRSDCDVVAEIYSARDGFVRPRKLSFFSNLVWSSDDRFVAFRGRNASYVLATETFPSLDRAAVKLRCEDEIRFSFSADARLCMAEPRKGWGEKSLYGTRSWRLLGTTREDFDTVDVGVLWGCFGPDIGWRLPAYPTASRKPWLEAAISCPWAGGEHLAIAALDGHVELLDIAAGTIIRRLSPAHDGPMESVRLSWGGNHRTLVIQRGEKFDPGPHEVLVFGATSSPELPRA